MKKILAFLLSALFVFGFAACNNGGNSSTGGGEQSSSSSQGDKPEPKPTETYGWNADPVVKSVFYDDFSNGLVSDKWTSTDNGWGANNNGVSSKNVMYSTNKERVEAEGASGGIVVLKTTGDYAEDKNKRRQGSVIITRNAYGAGKYEVRLRVLPREGQCTALWTYWNGTPNATKLEDSKYSEIDIELPEKGDFRQMSGTTYEKYVDKKNMNQSSAKINFAQKGMGDLSLNDGQWHTLAFEWRTAENDTGIIWYVDGQAVLKHATNIPVYTAPFWIGSHFPDLPAWIGVPNFDTAYMYIDWVRITEYDEPTISESTGSAGDFVFTDLGSAEIPQNNYVTNGDFSRGSENSAFAWEADLGSTVNCGMSGYESCLIVNSGNRVYQNIENKYKGHKVELKVKVKRTSGSGEVRVYLEEYYGGILPMEKSNILSFKHPFAVEKNLIYTLTNSKTDVLRIVIETDEGTTAEATSVELYEAK